MRHKVLGMFPRVLRTRARGAQQRQIAMAPGQAITPVESRRVDRHRSSRVVKRPKRVAQLPTRDRLRDRAFPRVPIPGHPLHRLFRHLRDDALDLREHATAERMWGKHTRAPATEGVHARQHVVSAFSFEIHVCTPLATAIVPRVQRDRASRRAISVQHQQVLIRNRAPGKRARRADRLRRRADQLHGRSR